MTEPDRMREMLARRTAIALLATQGGDGAPEMCILIAPEITPAGEIAGGEEDLVSGGVFRNLRRDPSASLLVLDPINDPRARDGVRVRLEFLGAENEGEGLERMNTWLSRYAPGRRIIRRLLFKCLSHEPYRPPVEGPILREGAS